MKAYLKIEMPACINCRFCQAGDSTSYCLAQSHELEHGGWYMHHIKWDEGIGYEAQKTWREKTCPLVPVPPHGRLGDLDKQDAQIEALIERHLHGYTKSTWDFVCELRDILKRNPTIIPAESITAEEEKNDK